jgi:hypothetical protein
MAARVPIRASVQTTFGGYVSGGLAKYEIMGRKRFAGLLYVQ